MTEETTPLPSSHDTSKDAKKIRKRKKKLHKDLKEQMEFYFSDANLQKDKFLGQLVRDKKDGFIPLHIFKTFNKIKALTSDIDEIKKALKNSELLEINEEGNCVRRITPIQIKSDTDACTIYVEGLPHTADVQWVRQVFSDFGSVDYVSMPRFKKSGKIKGFAFVEFNNCENAQKALDYFSDAKLIDNSYESCEAKSLNDSINKDQNVIEEENPTKEHTEALFEQKEKSKKKKRKHEEIEQDSKEETPEAKKYKSDTHLINKGHLDSSNKAFVPLHHPPNENISSNEDMYSPCKEENKSIKLKEKKRKKKTHGGMVSDGELLNLRVMSKAEWKQYRNKYLAMQKSIMAEVKKNLMVGEEFLSQENEPEKKGPSFQKGVIIFLKLDDMIENPSELKSNIKQHGTEVEYVDINNGTNVAYVRCKTPEASQETLQHLGHIGHPRLLEGKEEDDYWQKIQKDREDKINKKISKTKKVKGKQKIIAKVANKEQSKHIFFDA